MPNSRARRWCFTINNYTDEDVIKLDALGNNCTYLVYGKETGDNGTPHLQGYCIFDSLTSFTVAKGLISDRAHLEVARGSPSQASQYCKKDGDYKEYGELPSQGKRSDWERYREWIVGLDRVPTKRELAREWPSLYARYARRCTEIAEAFLPEPELTTSQCRLGWQTRLEGIVEAPPTDRTVHFVVDPQGNSGKSWFCRYCLTKWPDKTQVLRIGKRDDLCYTIDATKRIFLFDIPRGQMEFLQYNVLESLKDQMIFSPKYESSLKVLRSVPTVVVFSNEHPDMDTMTADRYNIIEI